MTTPTQNPPRPPVRQAAAPAGEQVVHSPLRWGKPTVGIASLAPAAVAGVTIVPDYTAQGVLAAGAAAAVAAGTAVFGIQSNRRGAYLAVVATAVNRHVGVPVELSKPRWASRVTGLELQGITVTWPLSVQVALGEVAVATIAAAVRKATGVDMSVVGEARRKRRVVLRVQPVADDAEPDDDVAQERARVGTVAAETFGASSKVAECDDDGEKVTRFAVKIAPGSGARLSKKTSQRMVTEAVTSRLEGRWRTTFDLPNDVVEFTRRVPLPTYLPRATDPVPPEEAERIPQGVDEDGQVIYWDISGVMAHMLKAGKTRTGKTVSLIGDAVESARRGFRVYVLDPKRTEFLGLRDWPNVQLVATVVEQQVALVYHLKLLMEERYRQIEEDGAQETDFERVVFKIDEYRQFYGNVNDWWTMIKVSGMPAKCPVLNWIGSLLRMAGACRIHVVLGTQRPDAEFLDGEIRDNFSARAATGRLTPDGAQMMFDNQRIGTTIPLNIRGRGTIVDMDDRPREVQYFFTPDPRKATSDEDRTMLRELLPATTRWPKQRIVMPEREEATDLVAKSNRKTCPEWEQILSSRLIDTDEPSPGPQWDAHGLIRPGRTITDTNPDDVNPDGTETGTETETTAADSNAAEPAAARAPADADADAGDSDGDGGGDDDQAQVGEGTDVDDGYAPAEYTAPAAINIGDLILSPDAEDTWVVVTKTEPGDEDQLIIEWRDDDDTEGETLASLEEMLEVRRPLDT